jgi:CheY-like chemotaxis protein
VPQRVILYVEDDDAAFMLVRIALDEEALGVRLVRARDGDEAFRLLLGNNQDGQKLRPDLILLDLNLPRKNGLSVLSDLKDHEALRTIPVVMFSTSSLPQDRSDALKGGAQDYITKPSTVDMFIKAVKSACSVS